ncbi:MAG TPA: magnesium/cobalt transporter CorA [Chitinophagaceae bacterium]|nr:magnesium/cobalt transporter CorA [Chitinophagaceae bacterium]
MRQNKYLKYLGLPVLFGTQRTKEILYINPTAAPEREEPETVSITVYDYTSDTIEERKLENVEQCYVYNNSGSNTWINVDGLRKAETEAICAHFGVHALVTEDILSINQRPKMDEVEGLLFCLLNMLYFNEKNKTVETEQISIVVGDHFALSFQEDAHRDVFDPLRNKLKIAKSQVRQRGADYLLYAMLDMIVDNYYLVMEKLGEQVELVEEEVVRSSNTKSLAKINQLRKELIVLKRNIAPVRELVNGFIRSESDLLEDRTTKYFKDVYDHIVQAYDLTENYRDMMMSMQDLYINNVNLRMNEVMKVMAVVTCLMAPATVIGGIFGMNFDRIPYLHNKYGFFIAVALMLIIPIWMLRMFRGRGWF